MGWGSFTSAVSGAVGGVAGDVIDEVEDAANVAIDAIKDILGGIDITDFFKKIIKNIKKLSDKLNEIPKLFKKFTSSMDKFSHLLDGIDDKLMGVLNQSFKGITDVLFYLIMGFGKIGVFLYEKLQISKLLGYIIVFFSFGTLLSLYQIMMIFFSTMITRIHAFVISIIITVILSFVLFFYADKIILKGASILAKTIDNINFKKIIMDALGEIEDEMNKLF